MRTFQGQKPARVPACKSGLSEKRLCKLPDNVEVHIIDDDDDSKKDFSVEDASRQLVLYNPVITHEKQRAVEVTEPVDHNTSLHQIFKQPKFGHGTVLHSIGITLLHLGKNLDRGLRLIGRYLAENPHYIRQGNLSQFPFATPKPLHEDYVQKNMSGEAYGLQDLTEVAQVDPLCWAAPTTRREPLGELGSSSSDHVDLHQAEVPGHGHIHQSEVSESPAPHPKKRTVKQVSSRKHRRTPRAATCSFGNQSGGYSNDVEHVVL